MSINLDGNHQSVALNIKYKRDTGSAKAAKDNISIQVVNLLEKKAKPIVSLFQEWNVLALDGSNWQRVDLFDFQRDVEVCIL